MANLTDPNTGETITVNLELTDFMSERIAIEKDGYTLFLDVTYGSVPNEPLYRDYAWLHAEYVENGRTMAGIAKQFGVTAMTIHGWLKKHGIPTRPRGRPANEA